MSQHLGPAPHGTKLRYTRGCRCAGCTRAAARYEQERLLDVMAGRPRRVPILGSQRRLQALCALGYDWKTLGRELGVSDTLVQQWATKRTWMYRDTVERVAAVYDRLSITQPPADTVAQRNAAGRARGRARRNGWHLPEVWIDIDDPAEDPDAPDDPTTVDEVAVQRILDGDTSVPANRAERVEVVARWRAAGRPLRQLELLTGWKTERYYDPHAEQVAS